MKFADVLEIKNGKNQKQVESADGQYPIYGSGGIMGWATDYICPAETVIIGRKGTINNPIYVDRPFWNVDTAFGLVADKKILAPKYLYYFCKHFDFLALNTTVTIPSLTKANLLKIDIPIPSAEEQKYIVEVLDDVESLIEIKNNERDELDSLVKSRFIEMFGEQEQNPYSWEQTTIGECCTLKSGTSLSADVENEGGSIPYIKVGDMNYPGNERYITTSSRYVTEKTAGKGLFEIGSVLFPKRGGAIGTNKKRMTKLEVCADLNVMGVSTNGKHVPEYLFEYFNMIDLGALSDGSSVPQINNKNIAPLVICIPPIELQNQFATFVKQTDKLKFDSIFIINYLRKLREKVMKNE